MASHFSSTDFIDTTIANLKVIAMVPKNGKLCIRKGCLCLDYHQGQFVRRWVNGDSREMTLLHIKNTISNAMKIAHMLMKETSPEMLSQWTVNRILDEMIACESGLENLKTTYNGDSMMLANLEVIMDRQCANRAELDAFVAQHDPHKCTTIQKCD